MYLRQTTFIIVFAALATRLSFAADFIPIGALPDFERSFAYDVSDDGTIVVGRMDTVPGSDPWNVSTFRWTVESGAMLLDEPGFVSSMSPGDHISGDGSTIIGLLRDSPLGLFRRFVYTEDDGMRVADDVLGEKFGSDGGPRALSFDGSVLAGHYYPDENNRIATAFRWTKSEGIHDLGVIPGHLDNRFSRPRPRSMSADGSAIVGSYGPSPSFIWTEETGMESLGFISHNRGPFISDDGTVVGGDALQEPDSEQSEEAVRWTAEAGLVGLGWLDDSDASSHVRGLNVDGTMIVGSSRSSEGVFRAFLWTEDAGMQDLQQLLEDEHGLSQELEGWNLGSPQGLSANGQFMVGWGSNPAGDTEGWLVRLDAMLGDFNNDGLLTASDIDVLSRAIRDLSEDVAYDLNSDGSIDGGDHATWVTDIAGTFIGDANLDKEVAFADFLTLSENFSQPGGWGQGDFNGNGEVLFEDFLLLSENFGNTADVAAVPEPSTFTLLLLPVLGSLAVRKRRIRSRCND